MFCIPGRGEQRVILDSLYVCTDTTTFFNSGQNTLLDYVRECRILSNTKSATRRKTGKPTQGATALSCLLLGPPRFTG